MTGTALDEALAVVTHGTLELEGRLVDASNTTVRCWASLDGVRVRCVYKPVAGERPLWDFPDGTLAGREVSAYLLSESAGFDLVPPTVLRDGPLGPGACQLWVEDSTEPLVGFVRADSLPPGWFPIVDAEDEDGVAYRLAHADDPRLATMAVFDAVVNNADRKGGHLLVTPQGNLYGVDHGVCFHIDPKLRTVLWGWAGKPLPAAARQRLAEVVRQVEGPLGRVLSEHLSTAEVAAITERARRLSEQGRFPSPQQHWPTVPWPPM